MRERLLEIMPGPVSEAMLRLNRCFGSGVNVRFHHELQRIHRKIQNTSSVMQGPFQGTRMMPQTRGNWLKQVLGTYEKEVWPAVEHLCEFGPDVVVNVGAAAGYYSIGLARRLPNARVVAFEGQRLWRHMHERNARANAVTSRVDVRAFCTPDALESVIGSAERPVVIVDCDGGEDVLLDPGAVPTLRRSVILVEVHDHRCAGVSGRLRARFANSHAIEEFYIDRRSLQDLPSSCALDPQDAMVAMDERRQAYPQPVWLLRPHD